MCQQIFNSVRKGFNLNHCDTTCLFTVYIHTCTQSVLSEPHSYTYLFWEQSVIQFVANVPTSCMIRRACSANQTRPKSRVKHAVLTNAPYIKHITHGHNKVDDRYTSSLAYKVLIMHYGQVIQYPTHHTMCTLTFDL